MAALLFRNCLEQEDHVRLYHLRLGLFCLLCAISLVLLGTFREASPSWTPEPQVFSADEAEHGAGAVDPTNSGRLPENDRHQAGVAGFVGTAQSSNAGSVSGAKLGASI
ncbi:MAG: hypothetical protein LC737_05525, partial [Chloroflexi bacterium]|nr:hypothetical protein [Chloroflexota bacterium]